MAYVVFLVSVLLALVAIYGAAISWLYFRQERLLFEPEQLAQDQVLCADADVRELFVDVPGARLSVAQLQLPRARGVMFFLHGNSGNLQKWLVGLDTFRELNYDVVMFDYRGFGKSSGRIESEAQLHADVQAVWAQFAPQYEGRRVVVAGQSLGTGLAAGLSAEMCSAGRAPDLTIMVSAYSSMQALGAELYPWVPSRVLRYPLATLDRACRLTGKLMLIHGDKDELIGFHHSQALHRAMPLAQLHCVEGAGHSDVHQFPSFRQAMHSALAAL
ncbi:alpha/beta fold hydrolase [uncultured Ramlibacter sp.]|uniref:alpha/beta hydrolase n=1 Tax=uncultured Ramlibacter sp. TaxID=260755 RepID=UPI0026031696|nr:alpha/beta fold hydrolase [uncultured Ramlibacter sp.]